jgi:hypothetical protein
MIEDSAQVKTVLILLLPAALWVAFWLGAVNWKKTWPVLQVGGWAPSVLLLLVTAGVWSRIAPSSCNSLKFVTIPNFWWQFGSVSVAAGTALLCGWLQGCMGWTPTEYSVDPPEGDDHGHGHAHH